MKHKHFSGGFIFFIGMWAAFTSWHYKINTLANMGPGYYPFALGVILAFLGLIVAFGPDLETALPDGDTDGEAKEKLTLTDILKLRGRAWFAVTLSIIAMVFLGEYFGMVPATFVCVLIAAFGDKENSLLAALVSAIVAVVFAVVVFNILLEIPIPLFNWPY